MSTRCYIGIEMPSGSILTIYCHHDGYPEGVGDTLLWNYKDRDKVEELLKLGDISSLRSTLESTEAYHRDRGEPVHPARIRSEEDLIASWGEYLYKFNLRGNWEVKSLTSSKGWHSIEAAISSPEILEDEDEEDWEDPEGEE